MHEYSLETIELVYILEILYIQQNLTTYATIHCMFWCNYTFLSFLLNNGHFVAVTVGWCLIYWILNELDEYSFVGYSVWSVCGFYSWSYSLHQFSLAYFLAAWIWGCLLGDQSPMPMGRVCQLPFCGSFIILLLSLWPQLARSLYQEMKEHRRVQRGRSVENGHLLFKRQAAFLFLAGQMSTLSSFCWRR